MQSKTMEIECASTLGMCFGVRDALALAFERRDAQDVTIWGELVHNETVLERLRERGFAMTGEAERGIPATDKVLLTAHGVSRVERERLERAGKELIDSTCPLVALAHDAARGLAERGYHVIVIGKPGHVEVRGLVGDLASYDVVARPEDVAAYPHERLGVVCQTTCPEPLARAVVEALRARNPEADVRFADTICEPTRRRIRAAQELARRCAVVVVVGGKNSNNTRELAALCAAEGAAVHHVQGAGDLDAAWFEGCARAGLTAGTSTLQETIEGVLAALERIAAGQGAPPPSGRVAGLPSEDARRAREGRS